MNLGNLNQHLSHTPIPESALIGADVAAVLGFFLLTIVCSILFRWVAILLSVVLALGAPVGLCYLIHQREIKTWEELAIVTALAAATVTASLFTLRIFVIEDKK